MLPGGDWVLFTLATAAATDGWDRARIVVQSLTSGERKTLIEGGSDARYLPTGHLVYALGGVVFAVPFDLRQLAVTGGPVPVVEGVKRPPAATGPRIQHLRHRLPRLHPRPGIDVPALAEPLRSSIEKGPSSP